MLRQRAITNILIFEIIGFGKIYQTLRTIFLKGGGGVSLCFVFYLKDLTNPVISQIKHKKKRNKKTLPRLLEATSHRSSQTVIVVLAKVITYFTIASQL